MSPSSRRYLFACTAGGIAGDKPSRMFESVQYGTDADVPKERSFSVSLKKCDGVDSLNQLREVKMAIPVETDQFYVFRRMGNVWGSKLNIRMKKCKLTDT
jgi:hypothetical protein